MPFYLQTVWMRQGVIGPAAPVAKDNLLLYDLQQILGQSAFLPVVPPYALMIEHRLYQP